MHRNPIASDQNLISGFDEQESRSRLAHAVAPLNKGVRWRGTARNFGDLAGFGPGVRSQGRTGDGQADSGRQGGNARQP
jgi:hypothetical protein